VSDAAAIDLCLLLLRGVVGVVMVAHGVNHIVGGGKIAGTGRWFESIGMRPGIVHAWLASLTEVVAGVLLLVGLGTSLAAAGALGVMLVAWITNHRGNGFFIFRPGEGWEYVMTLAVVAVAIGGLGAGGWSLDDALDLDVFTGASGLAITVAAGGGGAAALLAGFWRPPARDDG
jgi:putative oxidoreductase